MKDIIKVCVTGAAGQIAYSLYAHIGSGQIFGEDQPIELTLLDISAMIPVVDGVVMELQDCAFPLLKNVLVTDDPMVAFLNVDVIFMVGSMPRKAGMQRKDLLHANVAIFQVQGKAIDRVAKKSVLVVGNPANTNALVASYFAPGIPKENFSALTRLDQNRAISMAARKCNALPKQVKQVIIWGNHSNTQYADLSHAVIDDGKVKTPVGDIIKDPTWTQGEFLNTIQQRGAAVLAARKLSSALSAAKAIADHMRNWWFGTAPGEWVAMAVISDGSYGIASGIMYSFPITVDTHRNWKIVQGLSIDSVSKEKMVLSMNELLDEKIEALSFLQHQL